MSMANRSVWGDLQSGQDTVSTSGTSEQLNGGTSLKAPNGVTIRALNGNGGNMYVGGSDVSASNGYELAAGQEVYLPVDDVADIHIDADTDTEGVSWVAVQDL